MGRLIDYDNPEEWAKSINFEPGTTICFYCGKSIDSISDCIFWAGSFEDGAGGKFIHLHNRCTVGFATHLLMDNTGISERMRKLYNAANPSGRPPLPLATRTMEFKVEKAPPQCQTMSLNYLA